MRTSAFLAVIILLTLFTALSCVGPVLAGVFSPDGEILAARAEHCQVVLWNTATGKKIAELYEPRHVPGPVVPGQSILCQAAVPSFSPDGNFLATHRTFEPIILWNVKAGDKRPTRVGAFKVTCHYVDSLSFSEDSRVLVAVGWSHIGKRFRESTITVWDVSTHKMLLQARARKNQQFKKVALSPDGRTLVASQGPWKNRAYMVILWDIERGKELVTFRGHSPSFSPHGRLLYVTDGGTDMLWDIKAQKMRILKDRSRGVQAQSE